ncbi:amidase family protein [Natronococcus sp. A-GB1]|uniref:amidase n=1 Tax=Natronococcus sp. A-GB1 TaxID=3037648 RepID=UPI00241F600C|nr:amidase family protein [Natronococcus sp. A-GB1]MDG5759923.1 amidase family protein [Natronococcus sp. A-GB1]
MSKESERREKNGTRGTNDGTESLFGRMDRRTVMKGIGAAGLVGVGASSATASTGDDGFDLVEATVADVHDAIESGEATARDIVEGYLERIEVYDEAINSIISVNEHAMERAAELDEAYAESGPVGPLHGVPLILKDNNDTGDVPTTNGSLSMEHSQPEDDAFIVRQLREAGCVVVAKANLDEFARGITADSSLGGQTRNPYALGRNPSGSSAGTGAALAANLAVLGTGTDTCGSTRNPSAFGSLAGLRPTIGLISRDGIIPLSLERDTAGPMARTVTDMAVMLDAMVGYDPADPPTSRGANEIPANSDRIAGDSYTDYLDEDALDGLCIGVLRDFFGPDIDEEDQDCSCNDEDEDSVAQAEAEAEQVTAVVESALEEMERQGAEIVEIEAIPNYDDLQEAASEPSVFKADLDAYLEGVDNEYETLAEIVESDLYSCGKADSLRTSDEEDDPDVRETDEYTRSVAGKIELRDAVEGLMLERGVDVLAYPTLSHPPAEIGESQPGSNCSLSANSQLPAIAVPAGYTEDERLPVGVEMLGFEFDEPTLIGAAYAYEQAADPRETPDCFGPLPAEAPAVPNPDYEVGIAAEDDC